MIVEQCTHLQDAMVFSGVNEYVVLKEICISNSIFVLAKAKQLYFKRLPSLQSLKLSKLQIANVFVQSEFDFQYKNAKPDQNPTSVVVLDDQVA